MILDIPTPHLVATGIATVVAGVAAVFYKRIASGIVWGLHRAGIKIRTDFGYHVNCPGQRVEHMLSEIQSQLRMNGGSSMHDAVRRTERMVVALTREVRYLRVGHDLFTESVSFPAFRTDVKGHTVWVNRVLKLLAGITDDADAMGLGWLSMVHSGDRDRVRANWLKAIEEQREYSDQYRIVTRPHSKIITIVSTAKPIRTDEGIMGWSGTFKIVAGRREGGPVEGEHVREHVEVA